MNLDDLRGWMRGEDCVVVGCGPSAVAASDVYVEDERAFYPQWHDRWSLACNESIEWAPADFPVCVEPIHDRTQWNRVAAAAPLIVFSHLAPRDRGRKAHHRVVVIPKTADIKGWLADDGDPNPLTLGQCPFYAAAVAGVLGFETIGLIGVDLSDPERWPDVSRPDKAYGRLATALASMGSRLVNLSPESRLTSIPKVPWSEVREKRTTPP